MAVITARNKLTDTKGAFALAITGWQTHGDPLTPEQRRQQEVRNHLASEQARKQRLADAGQATTRMDTRKFPAQNMVTGPMGHKGNTRGAFPREYQHRTVKQPGAKRKSPGVWRARSFWRVSDMAHLTTENLVKVLDALVTTPHWRKAMGVIRASEKLAFYWRAQSSRPLRITTRRRFSFWNFAAPFDFWHAHAGRARTENIILHEATVRDQSLNGMRNLFLVPIKSPYGKSAPSTSAEPTNLSATLKSSRLTMTLLGIASNATQTAIQCS